MDEPNESQKGGGDDVFTLRMAVAFIGIMGLVVALGVVYLAAHGREPGQALVMLGAAAITALAALLPGRIRQR